LELAKPEECMETAIETKNLMRTFSRGRVVALKDVSIKVGTGRIFGLLGPNGAGKTTFIKILLGLLKPHQGSAMLFDVPVHLPSARNKVGYLPENHRFPGFLSGMDVLHYCARLSGLSDKHRRMQRAEMLLKRVNMWEWRKTKIRKYSKGMLQRLGLAQALIHDPDLIFLDEPTDGVDPIGRKEIRDLLQELNADGKTIFLNSHLLSEVEMICDEVAILNHGKLLQQGTVHDLTTSDRQYRIHAEVQDPAVLQRIRDHALSFVPNATYLELTVANAGELNAIIDVLRQSGILIQGVVPQRKSLEQSFIQAIQSDGRLDFNAMQDENFKTEPMP